MSFGYAVINSNGLNDVSQIRRSVDMVYQRGATYEVVLTGTTLIPSMELIVDMYSEDTKVGQMSIVPYNTILSGSTYYYYFGIRPYDYMSNYIESEHYTGVTFDTITIDYELFDRKVNVNKTYKNIIKANYKYGYRYYSGGTYVTEYTGSIPTNDFNHYWTSIDCSFQSSFQAPPLNTPQTKSTGKYFDLIGGSFQLDEKFFTPNFDQEMGSIIEINGYSGSFNMSSSDYERNLSPASQFIFDYPYVPYQSEKSRFLTDAPRIQYITNNDSYCLYYLQGQTGDKKVIEATYVLFKFYDVNNNRIFTQNYSLISSGATFGNYISPTGFTDTLSIWALPCGSQDLTNFGLFSNWTNVAYYTVQLTGGYPTDNSKRTTFSSGTFINASLYPVSEKFYFYLKDDCGPESTRLCWLNNRGGYDYYTFTSYRQDTKKISRQTYDNRQYQTYPNSPDRAFGRTIKTFATDIEQEIVLESDFLNLATGDWLQQLFYSPQVYIMRDDYLSTVQSTSSNVNRTLFKDLTPVQVLSTEVDTITKKHQKLNKYRITMKVANNFFVNKGF